MSPASYLAAPPRVEAGSIPPVSIAIWAGFGVCMAALLGGSAFVAIRALDFWRTLQTAMREAVEPATELVGRAERTAERATALGEKGGRGAEAAARLQVTIARARVLLAAAQEVQSLVTNVSRRLVPLK